MGCGLGPLSGCGSRGVVADEVVPLSVVEGGGEGEVWPDNEP